MLSYVTYVRFVLSNLRPALASQLELVTIKINHPPLSIISDLDTFVYPYSDSSLE
jgi:hypothetical protein